ncbi:unnamed protein product [Cuscuta epithymum]|uniref:Uncharacterized protein n=1 Tax=Cuscuta epithymum TaxID=186058 RepID=A0AAV0D2M4_9ASTE|nr:unnamed protein product [Cuscuta epithymum]
MDGEIGSDPYYNPITAAQYFGLQEKLGARKLRQLHNRAIFILLTSCQELVGSTRCVAPISISPTRCTPTLGRYMRFLFGGEEARETYFILDDDVISCDIFTASKRHPTHLGDVYSISIGNFKEKGKPKKKPKTKSNTKREQEHLQP